MTTKLQYRSNNAYDSILLVEDGATVNESTVNPAILAEFIAGGFDAGNWQGTDPDDEATNPDDYGDLLATYEDGALTVVEPEKWENRSQFHLREAALAESNS